MAAMHNCQLTCSAAAVGDSSTCIHQGAVGGCAIKVVDPRVSDTGRCLRALQVAACFSRVASASVDLGSRTVSQRKRCIWLDQVEAVGDSWMIVHDK